MQIAGLTTSNTLIERHGLNTDDPPLHTSTIGR